MNQKALILSIPIILAVFLFGGWLLLRDQKMTEESPKPPMVRENLTQKPGNIEPSMDVDTSNWKTYRNEEYRFELKYPEEWAVKENRKEIIESVVNRYVSITPPEGNIWVNFGIVNEYEKGISPRDFRTGLPAGEFQRDGNPFQIGEGVAEKRYLIYDNSQIMLLWFCKYERFSKKEAACEDFSVGKGKIAFVEVDVSAENWARTSVQWKSFEKNIDLIVQSFQFF